MNLREFLAWWLRGLRATAVAIDESFTQRRLNARDDADLARDIAELRALQSAHEPVLVPVPLTVSLETLWARPTVEPDYRRHVRPDAPTHEAAAWWLATVWPSTWGREPDLYRWCVANALLARREMADAGELVS